MFQSPKSPLLPAALLTLAVAQAASAAVTYQISPSLVTAGTVNNIAYTSVGLSYVTPTGYAVGLYGSGTNQLVYVYNPTTATASYYGFQSTDLDPISNAYDYTTNTLAGARAASISSTGSYVIGSIAPVLSDATPLGQDIWIAQVGATPNATTGIVTPTIVSPASTLTDAHGITTSYYYTVTDNGSTYNYRYSSMGNGIAVNASCEVLGTTFRYTGTSNTTQIGTDVWLNANGTLTPLGLGASSTDTGYAGNRLISGTSYVVRSSSLITNGNSLYLPNAVSLNDSGVVVGMTTRYNPNATVTSSSPTSYGQDAWMYNYNNSGNTSQIGLVGGSYQNGNATYQTSSTTLTQFNPSSQVAGQTTRYSGSSLIGADAWIYTPSGTPTTSTTFTNGYVQVGLTDPAATGVIGHATTVSSKLYRSSSVVALNNSGQAAGTSNRYNATSSTALGTDAWYDSGNGNSVNLSPTSSALTITGNTHSNYVNSGSTLTQTVVAMNSQGLVGGSLTRYNNANFTTYGQDGFIYDPHNNTEYVLASPSVASTTDFGFVQIMALSDAGVAVGYYQTAAPGATVPNADYIFAWTEAGGMVTLDQINTIVGGSGGPATVTPKPGLNNALAGQTGWAALANSITTNSINLFSPTLAVDANGNIYGLGNTTSSTATVNDGVYEISAVPEPASLFLLALAAPAFLRRSAKGNARKSSIGIHS